MKYQSGDYVACEVGTRACVDGSWGACVGTSTVTTKARAPSVAPQGLMNASAPCPTTGPLANPCDPYCNHYVDDAVGLTPDGGVTSTGGGLTIPGASGSSVCEYVAPQNPASAYAVLPDAWKPSPSPCPGAGPAEACGADSYCDGASQCRPLATGATYATVSPGTCSGSWDLTFGLPCRDAGTDTVSICNRGGTTAGAGVIRGVVQDASLAGQPTTVSLYKTLGSSVRTGTCSFDLAANPLAPGKCRSVELASLCPGADFTSGSGVRTIQWNMPDWSGGPDPARVAGECISSNNFTVYAPASVLACQGQGCSATGTGPTLMTAAGISACNGGTNLGGPAPTSGPDGCSLTDYYDTCKQDHRCVDSTPNRCAWNGGDGWREPACNGVDITVGAPCGPAGSTPSNVPFCNRGTQPVPAGTVLTFYRFNPTRPPSAAVCDPVGHGGTPVCSYTVPPGGLQPGECASVSCTNSAGNKYIVVKPSISECTVGANNACKNNVAYWKTDGAPGCAACGSSECTTSLTGKVYDPSGAGPGSNDLPLAGVTVFQPFGPLTPFTDGVACDTCASLDSPAIARAVTGADGTFTLTGVTPGPAVPIVVQSGRWRRQVNLSVTACTSNAVTNGTLRMPRDRTEGDIPKMAVSMAGDESLECFLRKVGISASEMLPPTSPADPHRIHLYEANGMVTTPPGPTIDTLWSSAATLDAYNALVLGCDGVGPYGGQGVDPRSPEPTAADKLRIQEHTRIGGRIFSNHWTGHDLIKLGPAPWPSTATWLDGASSGLAAQAKVLTGTPANDLLRDWLTGVGNIGTWLEIDQRRRDVSEVNAPSVAWLRGSTNWSTVPAGNHTMSYSFETPFGAPATCGRVLHNGMHVSEGRDGSRRPRDYGNKNNRFDPARKDFPANCVLNYALTEEEKALEYQLFQLTACALGGAPPPPPPAPLSEVVFVRDYEGVCPVGFLPEWGFFYWQATIAPGTSIEFRAATADDQASLPASALPAPSTVSAGLATTTVAEPNWGRDVESVGWHLANDPPGPKQDSKHWLRVFMKFKPIGAVAPVLNRWRMAYSCIPSE